MIAALILFATPVDPVKTLSDCYDYYQSLDSLSFSMECDNTSGLIPGHYAQTVQWKKGDLAIHVTTKNKSTSDLGMVAPDYYKKGDQVTTIKEAGRDVETYKPSPNVIPGWMVSGGPVLNILFGDKTMKALMKNSDLPDFFTTSYKTLADKEFEGHQCHVVEVVLSFKEGSTTTQWLIGADKPLLYSMTMDKFNGKPGKGVYRDYKLNPTLPDDFSMAPPAKRE